EHAAVDHEGGRSASVQQRELDGRAAVDRRAKSPWFRRFDVDRHVTFALTDEIATPTHGAAPVPWFGRAEGAGAAEGAGSALLFGCASAIGRAQMIVTRFGV